MLRGSGAYRQVHLQVWPPGRDDESKADDTGLGDEARGSFNQFADSLGDKIAGRDHPLPGAANNTDTIAQGEKERMEGRNQWNRASAEANANHGSTTATGTTTGTAPGATTGAGASNTTY